MLELSRFPRVPLAHLPTPLEEMINLRHWLSRDGLAVPRLFVKRDDCTGLAFGGNKARQLEFVLGDALNRGADAIVAEGAVQSNLVRSTAAAAAKLSMRCEVVLHEHVPDVTPDHRETGNVLLDQLLGAGINWTNGADDVTVDSVADRLREEGRRPYVLSSVPGKAPLGALGYIEMLHELLDQGVKRGMEIQHLVVATGGATSHAGILAGVLTRGSPVKVHGICVRRGADEQRQRIAGMVRETLSLVEAAPMAPEGRVIARDDWFAPGYGQASPAVLQAVGLGARLEGLILDPTYTGKTFAGLIGLVREGAFRPDQNVVFVHTGGGPGMFAHRQAMIEAAAAARALV